MNEKRELRSQLTEKLPVLVLWLFIVQPLMDILSFWVAALKITNLPTLVLRFGILALMVLAGFYLSRNKKVYYIAAAICLVIGVGHVLAGLQFGYESLFNDVSNYIRVLQLPLTTLCLITFLRANEKCWPSVGRGIAISLSIILACQVLAIVTGTEPHTYDDGRGLIGWFSNTNTQSAIVSMAGPVAVSWLYRRKGLKSLWLWICLVGSGVSMYFLGTRLAYLGIAAMCFGLGVSMLLVRLKDWKKAAAFLLVGVLAVALLPLSPMMGHRSAHAGEMADKQGWINIDLENPKDEEPDKEDDWVGPPPLQGAPLELSAEQRAKVEELTPIYEYYVSDLVKVFGVEKTIVLLNYTTDITQMTATRTKKLLVAEALMEESPLLVHLFGIELDRFTIRGHIFDVENDFHGIYYLYGVVGLAALLLFLAWFLWIIVRALIKNFKRYFTLEAAGWGIALVMMLAHCYFTAGVLRRPSASFYLGAVLAAVYYLVRLKSYSEETEG